MTPALATECSLRNNSKKIVAVSVGTKMIEAGALVAVPRAARPRSLKDYGCPVEFSRPRRIALAKIKSEAVRLGNNGTRAGFLFAQRLFKAIPELKGV